jgi:hypothetical protein
MTTRSAKKTAEFLRLLLRTGYLPADVPPIVTAQSFADYARNNYSTLSAQFKSMCKANTKYETYSAPRTRSGRRQLALVHPKAQLTLSIAIRNLIKKSSGTCYDVSFARNDFRAFRGLNFSRFTAERLRIFSTYPFVVKADVSRFFYTVYSHSLTWAVMGKDKAKDMYFNNRSKFSDHWSNKLDYAVQSAQSRETFGIPVGPDTSRILAELIMSRIEQDKEMSFLLTKSNYARLIDDFIIGFHSENDAKRAIHKLRTALWKFNLQLNEEKTGVFPSSVMTTNKGWQWLMNNTRISRLNHQQQYADIHYLMEMALDHCASTGESSPANWACIRLTSTPTMATNLGFLLECLFRFSREFPSCIKTVCVFFDQ